MKKAFLILLASLITMIVKAQEFDKTTWLWAVDSSAFDGISITCMVYGVTKNEIYTHPGLFVSKEKSGEYGFFLNYWPYGVCYGNKLFVKFNEDPNKYQVPIVAVPGTEAFLLKFWTDKQAARDSNNRISAKRFLRKINVSETTFIRLVSTCGLIDVEFTLNNANEVLRLLE